MVQDCPPVSAGETATDDLGEQVAVLILAGGNARRMGGEKPLRLLGEKTLLERALERARGWSDCVAISAHSSAQVGNNVVPVLIDAPGLDGPLAGLVSAQRLGRPLILTIPCDMPFLPDDLLPRLYAGLRPSHGAVLAASDGRAHPVCGLWRAEVLAELRRYCETGRRSLIGFAETVGYSQVAWPSDTLLNVNTPQDLEMARRKLR